IEVDAEGTDHQRIARAGADDEADVGAGEEGPQAEEDDGGHRDHEEPVGGKGHEAEVDRAAQLTGRIEGEPDLAPDELGALDEHEGQAKGEEQGVVRAPSIEAPDEKALDEEP